MELTPPPELLLEVRDKLAEVASGIEALPASLRPGLREAQEKFLEPIKLFVRAWLRRYCLDHFAEISELDRQAQRAQLEAAIQAILHATLYTASLALAPEPVTGWDLEGRLHDPDVNRKPVARMAPHLRAFGIAERALPEAYRHIYRLYAFSFERCLQEAATDEKELMLESLPAPSADSIIEAQAPTTKDDEAEHSEPGALPVTGMPTRTGSKTASTAPEESGGDTDKPTRRKQAAYERRWREQDELRTAVKLVLKDYSRGQLANLTANLVSGDRGPMDVATISTFACGLSVLQPSNERKLTLALAKIGIVLGHQSEP